jgi:lambda repressor-like predicted transcriptional regulator
VCARADEDWSPEDLDALLKMAITTLEESKLCHEAGAPHATLVMLGASLEAVLLGLVIAKEDEVRAKELWPKAPSRMHLLELTKLALNMGWLTAAARTNADSVLNTARTMAAHPGAYVRGVRQIPELDLGNPDGYQAVSDIVNECAAALAATL